MLLYLSRLRLDPRSSQVRAEMRSPYEMHRTLSKAFAPPNMPEPAAQRVLAEARPLFRVDQSTVRGMVTALIQSRTEPDWSQLTAADGYLVAAPEIRSFEPFFRGGQRFAFRLRANPTVKRAGKRRGLYQEEEQVAWLARKATAGGFTVEQAVPITEQQALRARRGAGATEHLAVRFDGIIRVADPACFRDTIAAGIGSAKGFGFGLLSIAPVQATNA